ncbi:GTP 3',8-cyclase MoaA [Virgibacillus sp. LDC-1]|uniref:GTP 3',8-cyclase MoaA n=1 Tax=Virgibacillus sp. LDC-1 TaxID=3039856 RepID=UPI0024DEB5E4|nr:GTP 3',8-cyclase MoaA [Virgibacillus sp. LDC-1]
MNITDKLGRPMRDLRISVTDRCNFRCRYCMPKEIFGKDYTFMPKDNMLQFDEIERLASIFVELGVKKLRITGGEPLLRRNLSKLIAHVSAIDGLEDIGLTTNGVLLEKLADQLVAAGLKRVNVSLDALNNDTFQAINDSGIATNQILKGIEKASLAGLLVKVNMVVKKGMNEQEILPMAAFFKEKGITLRFIEFMDVGTSNKWDLSKVVTKKEIIDTLSHSFSLEPIKSSYLGEVAQRYYYKGTNTEVGFITSVSESFCSTCTRARIAADGKLYTCLFASDGIDLKQMIRSGLSNKEIQIAIKEIWHNRQDRYSDERIGTSNLKKKRIEMSYIGG